MKNYRRGGGLKGRHNIEGRYLPVRVGIIYRGGALEDGVYALLFISNVWLL